MKISSLLKVLGLAILFFVFFGDEAFADIAKSQLHITTGMVNSDMGASAGSAEGSFSVMPSFDFQWETFVQDRMSFVLRSTMALDMATTITRYLFGGIGQRIYLNSRGSPLVAVTPEASVIIRPTFRYYVGWDVGISQTVVSVLSASLQSVTTAIDGGGIVGALSQYSDNFSFEASLTMSYAFGFSSVPASGMVMKAFFGGAYAF